MKLVKIVGIIVAGTLFFGCQENAPAPKVYEKRVAVQKGMTPAQVQGILQTEPDEISQVGNYEMWIYKKIIKKNGQKVFSNYIVKFVDGKVAYTGYFKCKLPNIEE